MNRSKCGSPKPCARILIVDDHPAVREGLALRISRQPDLEVCGEAGTIADALHLVAETDPDVAIIDIVLKTGNGIDLIKRIKAHHRRVRMLVCSMHSESLYAERALRAGAMGYINKEQATEQIITAIRQLLDGRLFVSEALADRLLNRAVGKADEMRTSPVERLSDRELEMFQLLGQGLDTHQIAERMRVSPKTVETYRARVKDKLNLATHTELIRQATQWTLEQH